MRLQVLAAIARHGSSGVRQRFLQLRVMPYLACQLDAELQATRAPPPTQPSRSDGSARSVTSAVRSLISGKPRRCLAIGSRPAVYFADIYFYSA